MMHGTVILPQPDGSGGAASPRGDDAVWVEILSRHREIAARFRIAGPEVRIGRGYGNEVVVDDPYVAARHLRVFRDDAGQLIAEDLGSANGMFLDGGRTRLARIIVDGKRPIRIGQTYVRVRDADHAVEPERVAKPALSTWPVVAAVALGMTILAIDELNVWLTQTAGPKASNYLSPLLIISSAILVWVGLWSVLSRIFSGRSRFLPNLIIAMLGVLALSLYDEFAQFAAFAWTWPSAGNYEYVAQWTILRGRVLLSPARGRPLAPLAQGRPRRDAVRDRHRRAERAAIGSVLRFRAAEHLWPADAARLPSRSAAR